VLRDADTYSSVTGGGRPYGGTLLQDLPIAGQVLNMMDDPRHTHIRRLVSSGLTPRMIRRVEDDLRRRARSAGRGAARRGVRLPGRHRGRAADADDLHPAGDA
jgi:cytochrome P450